MIEERIYDGSISLSYDNHCMYNGPRRSGGG